jgi:hypothetical protein
MADWERTTPPIHRIRSLVPSHPQVSRQERRRVSRSRLQLRCESSPPAVPSRFSRRSSSDHTASNRVSSQSHGDPCNTFFLTVSSSWHQSQVILTRARSNSRRESGRPSAPSYTPRPLPSNLVRCQWPVASSRPTTTQRRLLTSPFLSEMEALGDLERSSTAVSLGQNVRPVGRKPVIYLYLP